MTPLKAESGTYSWVEKLLQSLIVVFTTLTSIYIFVALIANFVSFQLWGTSLALIEPSATMSPDEIAAYKLSQFMYQIGAFLVPPLFLLLITRQNFWSFFNLNKPVTKLGMVWVLGFLILSIPASSFLYELLQGVEWPDALEKSEALNGDLMEQLLAGSGILSLVSNMIMFALVPAIVEEIFFRGLVQRLVHNFSGNAHWAVIVSATSFAFIHGQASGILGFLLMGFVLGYLYQFTGNLRLTMIFHFLNNLFTLSVDMLYREGHIDLNTESETPIWLGVISLLLLALLFRWFYQSTHRPVLKVSSGSPSVAWVKVFENQDVIKAQMVCDRLLTEGYDAVVVNKQDSSYGFGYAEVHVPFHQLDSAAFFVKQIILD